MDAIIDTLATGLASFLGAVVPTVAPIVLGILWLAFAWALIASQGNLDAAWAWTRGLPLLLQAVVWLLFLPIVAGLWIYETSWPFAVRIVVIAGILFWNVVVFMPRGVLSR